MVYEVRRSRRVFLAYNATERRDQLHKMLLELGHDVPIVTASGRELMRAATESQAEMLIVSPHLSDMDGVEALITIGEHRPTPAILIAWQDDLDEVERAMEDHVMAYLVEPVSSSTLLPAIYLCERRFHHFRKLEKKIDRLKKSLKESKLIEQAKMLLMQSNSISEPEAHQFIQQFAMKKRAPMVEIAEAIIQQKGNRYMQ